MTPPTCTTVLHTAFGKKGACCRRLIRQKRAFVMHACNFVLIQKQSIMEEKKGIRASPVEVTLSRSLIPKGYRGL